MPPRRPGSMSGRGSGSGRLSPGFASPNATSLGGGLAGIARLDTIHLSEDTDRSTYGHNSMFRLSANDGGVQQALKDRARASELRVIRRIFNNFDSDMSGTIDSGELRAVMEAMGHTLSDAQLDELVEQVDADGSGDIDFEEFVQLINIWKEANQFKLFQSTGTSLQEQRIEKAKAIGLLLPDAKRIVLWHSIVLAFVVYTFLVTGFLIAESATDKSEDEFALIRASALGPDIPASCVFGIDIIVTFFTAVRVSLNGPRRTEVIDEPKEVAKRYLLSPWFWVDLLAVPPVLRFLEKDQVWIAAFFIILKASKLPKLFPRSGKRTMTPLYVYVHFYVIPAIRVVCYFVFGVHLLAVVWTIIFAATDDRDGTASALANATTAAANASLARAGSGSRDFSKNVQEQVSYINSLYFVLYTLTTAGYGDVTVDGHWVRIAGAMVLCVCGTLLTGLVVGSVVSILSKTDIDKDRENKLRETLALCKYFDVPEPVVDEVLNFQDHLLTDSLSEAYGDLVMGLPDDMKLNINLFTRVDLVSSMPFFATAHAGAKVAIASLLSSQVYRPEENICTAGDHGDCMYFIGYGFVDVISKNGQHLAVLKRGGFFGEGALLQANQRRNATVRAVTYCDLFVLTRPHFEQVLKRFPRFRMIIIETSKDRARAAEAAAAKATNAARAQQQSEEAAHQQQMQQQQQQQQHLAAGDGKLNKKESFLHERFEKEDEMQAQLTRAHEVCDEELKSSFKSIGVMENLISELNRLSSQTTLIKKEWSGQMGSSSVMQMQSVTSALSPSSTLVAVQSSPDGLGHPQ